MNDQELTDLEGMDWDHDGGYWYSVANGDVLPDRLLAYTIWLRDENAALKRKTEAAIEECKASMAIENKDVLQKIIALLTIEEQE